MKSFKSLIIEQKVDQSKNLKIISDIKKDLEQAIKKARSIKNFPKPYIKSDLEENVVRLMFDAIDELKDVEISIKEES